MTRDRFKDVEPVSVLYAGWIGKEFMITNFQDKTPQIDASAFIAPDADIIGDVKIEKDCSVWFHAVLRGDRGNIILHEGCNVQDGAILHMDYGLTVEIGKHVTIGHGAIVHGAVVGDETLIGMGATVMNGARIGAHCVIGAGALVTQGKVIPDNSLVMGVPAKITGTVDAETAAHFHRNAMEYVEEARIYREAGN